MFANGNVTSEDGIVFVVVEKLISAGQDFPDPFEDFRVIQNLMLDQFLRDGEEHLGSNLWADERGMVCSLYLRAPPPGQVSKILPCNAPRLCQEVLCSTKM